MKRNNIIVEELNKKIIFYQHMGTSFDTEDPFDFKNLSIALADIKNVCFRNCDFSNTLFADTSFTNITFINCDLTNTKFKDSNLNTVTVIDGSIAKARFKNCRINHITIQHSEISKTHFNECEINSFYLNSTVHWAKFTMTDCLIAVATLNGYVSTDLPNTHFEMLVTKNAKIELKDTTELSIDSLKPYHTDFYPKSQVDRLKTVSKEIKPDTYETKSITNRPTFYGYSKN